jgi:hypothetical protein
MWRDRDHATVACVAQTIAAHFALTRAPHNRINESRESESTTRKSEPWTIVLSVSQRHSHASKIEMATAAITRRPILQCVLEKQRTQMTIIPSAVKVDDARQNCPSSWQA